MASSSNDITRAATTAIPPQTFDAFYRAHAQPVAEALRLTLQDTELAQDAANEAMVRALQKWKQVSRYDNPQGWVYRVGLNWARSWMRRRRRERERPVALGPSHSELSLPVDRDLEHALDSLSVDHRSVVVCRFFLDWSVAQTADALDIPAGTVKSRLARALDHIRTNLDSQAGA